MRFYTVSDDYIAFLQKHDGRVYNNGGNGYKSKKAYIGIVLEIGSHKFVAPLTSYKPAQDRIQSSACSAFKLHERTNPSNKLGMVALNNMIPVPDDQITELDIEAQDSKYKRLLYKQYEFIKANQTEIMGRAAKLYEHVVIKRTDFYVKISCDIPKLVDEYKNFKDSADQGEVGLETST
ncbi:type III toxin-antitoxin system ToxN/AbiQ family toxin [Agrobacterium radiobacter]|uniref:type III toxin-antitoxin system ToxN/AbiQ family toxin n=1 Tax=Agrobacterium radiobacter TaxID=362 RepID=UPI0016068AB2|nr:type III toxin-antitoxin system ToxN/AbiQ family toxin [Agrobacterium radiobacter]MBB4406391.1 protein AbiQ [Agrobacterium radiobacter]MBB4450200.1 protein AbiQ [Agrobacterium radiobacter]